MGEPHQVTISGVPPCDGLTLLELSINNLANIFLMSICDIGVTSSETGEIFSHFFEMVDLVSLKNNFEGIFGGI